jgi:hypothetical protein
MDTSKILEAFLPNLLTDRVLLGIVFLIIFTEDYLLISHQGNLVWLDQALPKLGTKDVLYFLITLSLSWLCVLPVLKAIFTIPCSLLCKGRSQQDPLGRLTATELLAQAMSKQDEVAYQHYRAHIKSVKERQVVRELSCYILAVAGANLCFSNSLIRHIFTLYPIISMIIFLPLVCLGFAIGIVGTVDNDDNLTDVRPTRPESSESTTPPQLSSNLHRY